uniref:Uncharacterized protein n=1 Tax=Arundo donax TaxID=35708 RepID=A0A0A9A261_ARUDO
MNYFQNSHILLFSFQFCHLFSVYIIIEGNYFYTYIH